MWLTASSFEDMTGNFGYPVRSAIAAQHNWPLSAPPLPPTLLNSLSIQCDYACVKAHR